MAFPAKIARQELNVVTPFNRTLAPLPQREVPHNFEAEQAVLGALFLDNSAYHRLADFLRPEHFADPMHGRIFEAMARMIEANKVATPITLKPFFDGEGALQEVGGMTYIARLAASAISIIDVKDYARQIHDLALRRRLLEIGSGLIQSAFDPGERSTPDLISDTEAQLFQAAGGETSEERLRDSRGALEGTFDRIDAALRERALPEHERRRLRFTTGLPDLDARLRISRGDLIIVAGDTSMGKSAFADGIAEANERNGVTTAVFAMEMVATQWTMRRIARHTGISSNRMADGDLSQSDYTTLDMARRELQDVPHFIDDTAGITVSQVRARLRRLKRQHNVGLCIIDYLQLMQPDASVRRAGTRAEELGQMTRALKAIAQELGIALIVLSQVNRAIQARDDKRPTLADLRESGSIEQDANAVLFVYREEYYLSRGRPVGRGGKAPSMEDEMEHLARLEASRGKGEIIVAKQREGEAPCVVHCRWDGLRTRFLPLPALA